jgi:hypothetical protein
LPNERLFETIVHGIAFQDRLHVSLRWERSR